MPVATGGFRCLGARVRLVQWRGGASIRMRRCAHRDRAQKHILGEQHQREQGKDRLQSHEGNVGPRPARHQTHRAFSRLMSRISCGIQSRARRSSCALAATMIVLSDIRMAPTAGESTTPANAKTPAASGIASTL